MFKNYLVVAVRNLMRQKLYSFINIFGLALGIACCLLMVLFVKHEWSYDRFQENRDTLYRLLSREVRPNGDVKITSLHPLSIVAPLARTFPGIAHISGFMASTVQISGGERSFSESFGAVHPDFLRMFSFPLRAGNAETALAQPDGVVISESMAHKFFSELQQDYGNVLGRTLTFHGKKDEIFEITGVMQAVPENSSLRFDFLIPIEHWENYGRRVDVGNSFTSVYVQLAETQDVASLEGASAGFIKTHMADRLQGLLNHNMLRDTPDAWIYRLQPLLEMYWRSPRMNAYEERGNPFAAYLLSGIAILVVLIACSNFITLSIGRSTGRAREVGIRKVVGAHRKQLIGQFWGEALLLSFLSLGVGLALADLFLPVFNGLIQKQLNIAYFEDGLFLLIAIGIVIAVGIVAGSYPALVLSRFKTVSVLKGNALIGGRSNITRLLAMLQYAGSIALLSCMGIMMQQEHYMRNKDLGFDKEHVVVVKIPGMDEKRKQDAERYKQALLTHSPVVCAAVSDRSLTSGSGNTGYKKPDGSEITVRFQYVDPDYIQTMGLTLLEGRNFSSDFPTDRTQSILVNEALVRTAGIVDPIGKPLMGFKYGAMENPVIIGIVRDFHTGPLYERIPPLVMQMHSSWGVPTVLIRIRPGDIPGILTLLEKTWKETAPGREFHPSFLDDNLERQYHNEQRWQRVLSYSVLLTIIISCLGLFGLSSLAVARRTKEVGIRKVMGATTPNLLRLLSGNFVKLIGAANLIAWPAAYYAMNLWLENFAYRIELGPLVFIMAGALALVIALLTVSIQVINAARANPVETLRYE